MPAVLGPRLVRQSQAGAPFLRDPSHRVRRQTLATKTLITMHSFGGGVVV